jgi:hypothetical protein
VKSASGPRGVNVSEWRFVEHRRCHHAVLGEVVHDQVYEFDLVSRKPRDESGERFRRRLAVETDQRAHEETQALVLLCCALNVFFIADAVFREHALQLREIDAVSALFIRSLRIATWS